MERVLEARNVGQRGWSDWNLDDDEDRPHPSPIVSAFAPRGYGLQDDLYALFIAEYLRDHLPTGTDLGHRTNSVAEQIARYRAEAESEDYPGANTHA